MKAIKLAALLAGAYSAVSIAMFQASRIYAPDSRDLSHWHHIPDGLSLRQMVRASESHFGSPAPTNRNIPGRFPAYGTHDFLRRCNWTKRTAQHGPECTFLVRPRAGENEGIALWVSQIVEGFILARQAGCRLMFDYGPDVDIHQVLRPAPDLGIGRDDQLHNWTVPMDFSCTQETRCFTVPRVTMTSNVSFTKRIPGRRPLASVPFYRFALWETGGKMAFYDGMFRDLERALPGFQIPTGMACSLGQVFHLAPGGSQFEPGLFTDLLPRVRDEDALVLTLYMRASQTEKAPDASENADEHVRTAKELVSTALAMEEKYLIGEVEHRRDIRRIIWMVITDSQYLKQWAVDTYGGEDVNGRIPTNKQKWSSREIPREILFTGSRGRHTRARQNPSTADFAEAFLDWFLLGEADLVIAGVYTFGLTGALRSACPVYNKRGALLKLVHSGEPTAGSAVVGSVLKIEAGAKRMQGSVARGAKERITTRKKDCMRDGKVYLCTGVMPNATN